MTNVSNHSYCSSKPKKDKLYLRWLILYDKLLHLILTLCLFFKSSIPRTIAMRCDLLDKVKHFTHFNEIYYVNERTGTYSFNAYIKLRWQEIKVSSTSILTLSCIINVSLVVIYGMTPAFPNSFSRQHQCKSQRQNVSIAIIAFSEKRHSRQTNKRKKALRKKMLSVLVKHQDNLVFLILQFEQVSWMRENQRQMSAFTIRQRYFSKMWFDKVTKPYMSNSFNATSLR